MRRIAILGHFGTENLGDEAVIAGVLREIRSRYPHAEVIAFTGHPEDARQRHGITAFPLFRISTAGRSPGPMHPTTLSRFRAAIRDAAKRIPGLHAVLKAIRNGARLPWVWLQELRFLAQSRARLQGFELLVIAGSNQLNDYWGGAWAFPYTLLKWCALAKSVGARVVFMCCGAGPLQSAFSKRLLRYSLALADCRSYRDAGSQRLMASIGAPADDPVCTDLAWGLRLSPPAERQPRSQLVVGLNPLPFFDSRYWPEQDGEQYRSYVGRLATFAEWLTARGHRVVFFSTQLRADPPVIEDIKTLLQRSGMSIVDDPLGDRPVRSLDDLLHRVSMMDVVVATRYHGVLLAAALHRPVLAIAYYQKTFDLMAQLGQSDNVVDITSFDAASLTTRFVAMESNLQKIRREIEPRCQGLQQAVADECDRVFGLLEDPSGIAARNERQPALAS